MGRKIGKKVTLDFAQTAFVYRERMWWCKNAGGGRVKASQKFVLKRLLLLQIFSFNLIPPRLPFLRTIAKIPTRDV